MDVVRVDPTDRTVVDTCAQMMIGTEPWITLRRSMASAQLALQDPGKELSVVFRGDVVAAFVLLEMRGLLAGYIQSICVGAEHRGRGIGTALIAFAEQRIFRDSPNVFICVSSFNNGAQRLYQRLGYEVAGRLSGFVVREHDELLLRKTRGAWVDFAPPPR